MPFVVVDLEATGLDVDTVKMHCLVVQQPGVEPEVFRPGQLRAGIDRLNSLLEDHSMILAGHNVIEYDIPILRRYGLVEPGKVYDTLVISRAVYAGSALSEKDKEFVRKNPGVDKQVLSLRTHSLKAWGIRLHNNKGDYDGGWETFNEEMLSYCIQDVALCCDLLALLDDKIPRDAALLECDVARLCRRMRLHGVGFDVPAAARLVAELAERRDKLVVQLRESFAPWYTPGEVKYPKRSQQSRAFEPGTVGYKNVSKDCPYQDIDLTEFNPSSGQHIADRLVKVCGWKPSQYTESGKVSTTAEVLRDLPFKEAELLAEYQELNKIIGYIAEGKSAWLKLEQNGRLHGKVQPTGTVTSRAAHSNPNLGNVPSRSALGHACRSLFVARAGAPGEARTVLVGADASGLQLRGLAHYLARWDSGAFSKQCETGDIHEYMRQGTKLLTRDRQKTWTYAKLFGAGKGKLGQIAIQDRILARERGIDCDIPPQRRAALLGQQTLDNLGNAIPAFSELEKVLRKCAKRGWMTTLDGRQLAVGSEHLAISVLLQGFEACVMKKAMVLAAPQLRMYGAEYVLWVHDEFQVECEPELAEWVGKTLVNAMYEAGNSFDLRVRIDGEYKVGTNWGETH